MPLMIQLTGRSDVPTVVCDHCGEAITQANEGNYQWSYAGGTADGQRALVYFTHKECCDAFEHRHGDPYAWQAIPLECLAIFAQPPRK
jgi:hypothetical protein